MSGPMDKVPRVFSKTPTRGWIVAPTYDLGEKEFRVFWELLVNKLQIPVEKGRTFYSLRTKDFRITTPWGSIIEVRSAEHPDSLVGEGLDWVLMAEAAKLKLSHWDKYIRPTLADKRGDAIFVSTPEGFNWFFDVFQYGQMRDFSEWWSIRSPSWDNTVVFPRGRLDPEIKELEKTLAPEVFDQEIGALFTSFAGRIYSEFDEGYHVIDHYEYNRQWPTYLAMDFGLRNPTAALSIQVDPSDNVYVWDEYYERGKSSIENARILKGLIRWPVKRVYHDPAGADEAETMRRVWYDSTDGGNNRYLNGIPFTPSPNNWEQGVAKVKEWLKLTVQPDGKPPRPKLFISGRCKNTIREFNTYRLKEQGEKVAEKADPKDKEPRKKDDHAVDAIRYFFSGHFGLMNAVGYQN